MSFIRQRARGVRTQRKPDEMNSLERRYAAHLEARKAAGEIISWSFDSVKLRLAKDKCWITVDFMVMRSDGGIEFHETKGFMMGDAWLKLKFVTEVYWMFDFFLVKAIKKSAGGGFDVRQIGGA